MIRLFCVRKPVVAASCLSGLEGLGRNLHCNAQRAALPPYAIHLLKSGLNLRLIQSYLGHASPSTTAIYTHLTKPSEDLALQAVNRVMAGLWD